MALAKHVQQYLRDEDTIRDPDSSDEDVAAAVERIERGPEVTLGDVGWDTDRHFLAVVRYGGSEYVVLEHKNSRVLLLSEEFCETYVATVGSCVLTGRRKNLVDITRR